MAYRLRYQAHDLELPPGEFVMGRGMDCQLALDDPLVSRRHAVLRVGEGGLELEDLGSRNGVLVNGIRIEGAVRVASGDRITIGSQEMTVEETSESAPPRAVRYRRRTETLEIESSTPPVRRPLPASPASPPPMDEPTVVGSRPTMVGETSRSVQSLRLIGSVAEKALALGRVEEAERLLGNLLAGIVAKAKVKPAEVDPDIAEQCARWGLRLAVASSRSAWLDYVFELYTLLARPLPAPMVDELYTVVRRVKGLELRTIRAYLAALRSQAASFGPADRFLLQRIEGLERLVALQ